MSGAWAPTGGGPVGGDAGLVDDGRGESGTTGRVGSLCPFQDGGASAVSGATSTGGGGGGCPDQEGGGFIVVVMLIFISLSLVLHLAALVCLGFLLKGRSAPGGSESLEPVLRAELGKARDASAHDAGALRTEVANAGAKNTETLTNLLLGQLKELRESNDRDIKLLREGVTGAQEAGAKHLTELLGKIGDAQDQRFEDFTAQLVTLRKGVIGAQEADAKHLTELLGKIGDAQDKRFEVFATQLTTLTKSNEEHIGDLGKQVQTNLKEMREGNEKKLEQMRQTVDEKLQGTLEKRLGESFKLVSEQLAEVNKGLGEMQDLAADVGGLQRTLTNVKIRGTWGEVQLGDLLGRVLTSQQYGRNVNPIPDSNAVVEYAIKLPGPDDDPQSVVWLPIDAKYPQEDYLRLQDASESGDPEAVEKAVKAFARTVEVAAADIRNKYLAPPHTTDFGILFLPTEGLYAEVLRNQRLMDRLQQVHRVVPQGPTTLAAFLNSLQMGFRTLALQKRSSEVWNVLAAVKNEFGKFGGVLDKLKNQLATASRTVGKAEVRTRAMERTLREVEELPADTDTAKLLGIPPSDQPPLMADAER